MATGQQLCAGHQQQCLCGGGPAPTGAASAPSCSAVGTCGRGPCGGSTGKQQGDERSPLAANLSIRFTISALYGISFCGVSVLCSSLNAQLLTPCLLMELLSDCFARTMCVCGICCAVQAATAAAAYASKWATHPYPDTAAAAAKAASTIVGMELEADGATGAALAHAPASYLSPS
jgi:hypothetical protein